MATQSAERGSNETVEGRIEPVPDLGQEPDGNALWSWVDLIDPAAWPNYCDEVNETFMGSSDADLFQNAFYT